jgi:uncharacterized protein (TIGR02421 family)
MSTRPEPSFAALRPFVAERLSRNQRIRRILPGGGRLRIDRQLPFLCVYRTPPGRLDPGTRDLVTTEAAYLFAPGEELHAAGLQDLCATVAETLQEHFGIVLILEVWSAEKDGQDEPLAPRQPAFRIVTASSDALPLTVDEFQQALREIRLEGHSAEVRLDRAQEVHPPGLPPLIPRPACRAPPASPAADDTTPPLPGAPDAAASRGRLFSLGLAVRPVFRDHESGVVFPMVLQRLRRQLARALRRAIFAFTNQTPQSKLHFDSLGPSAFAPAARVVDQQLSEVSEAFDFILQATPVNSEAAWQQFRSNGFREPPRFRYRPLPYHPVLLKRRLFTAPLENVEDPTLFVLFSEKQRELDRQLTALRDVGTSHFLYGSLQLYGKPDADLCDLARRILVLPGLDEPPEPADAKADDVAAHARDEIERYRSRHAPFLAHVEVRDDIASGAMVAGDRLLVARSLRARESRIDPLLHHEVGTHLLTYFNGREQPFRQLYAGLAGYDGLQEGLAILAEHLSGGLDRARLRTLAARVVAAEALVSGAKFVETFHLLHDECSLSERSAFLVTLRAYRAGGLTKDITYLRGLRDLLAWLREGHDIEPLYVGKIALRHLPAIQELRRRGVIRPPALLPRFWEEPGFRQKLDACRGRTVLDLLHASQPPPAAGPRAD